MPLASFTRRNFLVTSGGALAASALARSSLSAEELLDAPMAKDELRSLAIAAVDAGQRAGASYTDVRVSEVQGTSVELQVPVFKPKIRLENTFQFGVRVLVDGIWAFEYGTVGSIDAITAAAKRAVASARGYKAIKQKAVSQLELAPTQAVQGEWITPIKIDPFTVPIQDQFALLSASKETASRVLGSGIGLINGRDIETGIQSTREVRIFASSEGAQLTQTLHRTEPNIAVWTGRAQTSTPVWSPKIYPQSAGYEAAQIPNLEDHIKSLAEEAAQLATLPTRSMDVGRYPAIFDGFTTGLLAQQTIGRALEMDRVRGDDADAAGTSYLSPAETMLGTQVFGSLLNVTGHRNTPALSGVKWDDEGVEPIAHKVVSDGRLVDYHTSRDTAPLLREWYKQRNQEVRSYGCAVAPSASDPVAVRAPHLDVAPGTTSLDDMVKGISRGVMVKYQPFLMIAQQMASGTIGFGSLYDIEKGKIVRRLPNNVVLQFNTTALWKALGALGDTDTVRTFHNREFKGQPWVISTAGSTAPASFFKQINLTVFSPGMV